MTARQITKYHHHGLSNPTTKEVLLALNRHKEKTALAIWEMHEFCSLESLPSPTTIDRILRSLRSADLAQSSWIRGRKSSYVGYKLTTKGRKVKLAIKSSQI